MANRSPKSIERQWTKNYYHEKNLKTNDLMPDVNEFPSYVPIKNAIHPKLLQTSIVLLA